MRVVSASELNDIREQAARDGVVPVFRTKVNDRQVAVLLERDYLGALAKLGVEVVP